MRIRIRENAGTLELRLSRAFLACGVGDALCLSGYSYKEDQYQGFHV
jgi:ABC-type enterobactin transport system permease subunit